MKNTDHIFPVGYALKNAFKRGYTLAAFRHDCVAGLVVSLVALPLAMALAIAVGLPPQHGLYTSIVAGMLVPLLGGSSFQVTGATAAFVVIVSSIIHDHGLRGLLLAEMMAGIMLIGMGMARFGKYINYVPYPVTMGFTSGIAVVIATLAINDFLGLGISATHATMLEKIQIILEHLSSTRWPSVFIGGITLVGIFQANKLTRFIPSPIVAIGLAIGCNLLLQSYGYSSETIGDRFTYTLADGKIGHGIAAIMPEFHLPTFQAGSLFEWPNYSELKSLFSSALVIAGLCALQTLLSATVADTITGTKHQPNAELIAVGVGNMLAGMSAGLPASGAIARTETNIHHGAKTPFAAFIHAVLILVYVLLLAPYMSYIPMASLAALLVAVAYRMSHWQQFMRIIQIAPRSDTIVLFACFGFTVFVDMVAGVLVGMVLSCFLLFKRIADLTQTKVSHSSTGNQAKLKHLVLPDDVMVYHISGLLFLSAAEKTFDHVDEVLAHIKTLIIDLDEVPLIDMTGLVAVKSMIMNVQNDERTIILCGNKMVIQKILQKLPVEAMAGLRTTESLEQAITLIRK